MTNRLRKPIPNSSRKQPSKLPYLLLAANPDGTVRIEGPLKHRDLCYQLLEGGRAVLDEYFAKHPVAAVVAGATKLEVEHASDDQTPTEAAFNPAISSPLDGT